MHRRTTVWGERRSGSHVTSCAAATDGAPCLWGAHPPRRLPTPSIAHPVRCLGRWSRLGTRPQSVGSAFAPPLHCVGRATIWVSCDVLCRCDRWRPLLVGGTPTAPLANTIHRAPCAVPGAVAPDALSPHLNRNLENFSATSQFTPCALVTAHGRAHEEATLICI